MKILSFDFPRESELNVCKRVSFFLKEYERENVSLPINPKEEKKNFMLDEKNIIIFISFRVFFSKVGK